MKTQIIQLETHDDTISVRDKMDWSQTPRILLKWPEDGNILRNRLDLVLLERYCSANGSQLALLTDDQQVTYKAEEAGIPVFQSRTTAQLQPWGKSFREFKRKDIVEKSRLPRDMTRFEKKPAVERTILPAWIKIAIFAIAVVGVLAIGATLLPSATIRLPSVTNYQEITIPVQAVPDQKGVQISGIIPAHELLVTIDGEASGPATGTLEIPSEFASGNALFTNLSNQSIFIPANTVLSTELEDSPLFVTTESGETPAGKGSQIILAIQALEPGTKGNLAANMITRINQEVGADLSVNNPDQISGGSNMTVPAPNDDDHHLVNSDLLSGLAEMAIAEALQLLEPDDILISQEPEMIEILQISSDPEIGAAGDTLLITSTIGYRVMFASGADLQTLAEKTINALYAGGPYDPDINTINLANITNPVIGSDQIARWNMQVTWTEFRVYDQEEIIQNVMGKKPSEAEDLLQKSFDLSTRPEIDVNPSWWFRIPVLPFRIVVDGKIEY